MMNIFDLVTMILIGGCGFFIGLVVGIVIGQKSKKQ